MRVLIFLIVFMGALCFASRSASLRKLDQDKKKPRVKRSPIDKQIGPAQ